MLIKVKRVLIGALLGLGVAVGTAALPLSAAQAVPLHASLLTQDSGLGETSRSRYVIADSARVVRARTTVTIRNEMASHGGRYYFYVAYQIPVPAGATHVRATSNGTSLPVTVESTRVSQVKQARASFGDLYYGHSRTITWTYTLKGGAFRSKDPVRVGPGYAAFPVLADSDLGKATAAVVAPKDMELSAAASAFYKKETSGSTTTWGMYAGSNDEGIWTGVSARDPKQADERRITVGDTALTLQSFPGDKGWLDFVEKHVRKGLPELEKLIGVHWPGGLRTIREDVASEVIGYSWFNTEKHEIVLGEDFDEELLYHELSHAWINGERFQGRWLSEGLAQLVAHHAVTALDGKADPHPTPKRRGKAAFPLEEWESDSQLNRSDVYGYDASYAAVNDLTAVLRPSDVTGVLAAAVRRRSVYDAPGSHLHGDVTDWRRFLDLVEHKAEPRAAADDAESKLAKWALTSEETPELRARHQAQRLYRAQDADNGDWLLPLGLRREMDRWQFDEVTASTSWVTPLSRQAVAVQQAAARYGLVPSRAIRHDYESFDSDEPIDTLRSRLTRAASTTETVGHASRSVDDAGDPASRVGRWVLGADRRAADARRQLDSGHLAAAEDQARTATTLARWAPWTTVVLLVLVAGAVFGGVLFWRRYGDRVPGWLRAGRKGAVAGRAAVVGAVGRRLGSRLRAPRRARKDGSSAAVAPPGGPPPGPTSPPTGPPTGPQGGVPGWAPSAPRTRRPGVRPSQEGEQDLTGA